jgi:hypothetical protein
MPVVSPATSTYQNSLLDQKRQRLIDRESDFERDLYRDLISLSAVILGLSSTFSRTVDSASTTPLYLSWAALALTVVLVVMYWHLAQWAARTEVRVLETRFDQMKNPDGLETFQKALKHEKSPCFERWWMRSSDTLPQRASLIAGIDATITFLLGVLFLAMFAYQGTRILESESPSPILRHSADDLRGGGNHLCVSSDAYNKTLHRTVSVCTLNDRRVSVAHREACRDYRRGATPLCSFESYFCVVLSTVNL